MKLIQTENSLALAAAKAGMDEKTARKYDRSQKLPSQSKPARRWRNRPDVFKDYWPQIEQMLMTDPALQAVTIFDYLCRQYEGKFKPSDLRTLQRRMKVWRALYGKPKEVFFPQVHTPGQMCQSDFTRMGDLQVTIAGEFFDHLFYHFILTYSNWESGSICFSESFESLCSGLQNALWELGAVPHHHRSDSLSAAVNNLSQKHEFTEQYEGLLRHYHISGSHNNPGRANENGDVEQSHYRFKQAVDQELRLRGSRNFDTRRHYEDFLRAILKRRNGPRRERLMEELARMKPLPVYRMEDFTRETHLVSRSSTISVKKNIYSVQSQLIGEHVKVRLYAEHVEVWYAETLIHQMPRLRGEGKHLINYRHIIHTLVRKPGAFANYRWRADMFPRLCFRMAYDCLQRLSPATADKQYLKILLIAADESEQQVAARLAALLETGQPISSEKVQQMISQGDQLGEGPKLEVPEVDLCSYNQLLESAEVRL